MSVGTIDSGIAARQRPFRLYAALAGLYVAQGIPSYLILVALPPIMRDSGVSRTSIGLFTLLMVPLVLKFAWAPLVDRYRFLKIGHRRGWIVPTQIMVSLGIVALAFTQPTDVGMLFIICFVITIATSTQDIATDGYAVRLLDERTRPTGNAIQAGAVAVGVVLGGTLSPVLFQHLGWRPTLLVVAVLSLIPLAVTPWMLEKPDAAETDKGRRPGLLAFFARPGAWLILAVALTYRASEGLVRGMESTYLVDTGVPLSWIGYLQGGAATTSGLLGAVAAAALLKHSGITRTLLLLGALRTACFLAFAFNALDIWSGMHVAMSASAFQTFLRYMELVALYSLYMAAASPKQPGTDFTILACAELVIYLVGTSMAGAMADAFGYPALFLAASGISLLAVPLSAVLLTRYFKVAPLHPAAA